MREHQIVISLKAEHFQQVQRMSRAAGSKSIGMFVREKLLSSLGLDGQDSPQRDSNQPDWHAISGQLSRLHRELQVFIAESLTTVDYSTLPPEAIFHIPKENFLTEGAPVMPQPNFPYNRGLPVFPSAPPAVPPSAPQAEPFPAATDEMEKLADRAFAISPRLGALESVTNEKTQGFQDPLHELLEDSLVNNPSAGDEDEGEAEFDEAGEMEASQYADQSGEPEETERTTYDTADDTENSEDDEDDEDEAASSDPGIPPTPPPISGGPPPRKRRT